MLSPGSTPGQEHAMQATFVPAELEAAVVKSRDVPILYDDLSAGAGFSERLMPYTYAYGKNVNTRNPRVILPGPYVNSTTLGSTIGGIAPTPALDANCKITSMVEWNGDLWLGGGNGVWKVTAGTGDPVLQKTFTAGFAITAMLVFRFTSGAGNTGGHLCVFGSGGGSAKGFAFRDLTAGTWSEYTSTPSAGQPSMRFTAATTAYQVVAGSAANRIVAADSVTSGLIWTCSGNPFVPGNWVNSGAVGNSSMVAEGGYPVRSMAGSNRHVYFCTDVGVFDMNDQGYSPNLTPYWRDSRSTENGQAMLVYDGKVFALNHQGIDMVEIGSGARQDTSQWAGLGAGTGNETPIFGQGSAMTVEGGWLVVNFYNELTLQSNVMYGKRKESLGLNVPGPMVWHGAEITLDYEKITAMGVNNLHGTPRLWITTQVTSTTGGKTVNQVCVYWASAADAATPLQEYQNAGAYEFATCAEVNLSAEDAQNAINKKTIMRFDVQADNLGFYSGTAKSVEIQAANTLGPTGATVSSYISLNTVAGGSPRAVMYPQVNGNEYVQGYRPKLKLILRGHKNSPPILRSVQMRLGVIEEQREVRTYTLDLSHHETRNLVADRRSIADLKNFLIALQTRGPVPLNDEFDEDLIVKVESGMAYATVIAPNTGAASFEAKIVVSLLTQTPETGLSSVGSDDRFRYDDVIVWADTDGTATGTTGVWQ